MSKRIGVLAGRFAGYHLSHHEHVVRACNENDVVVILLGSSNRRISIKNPFTVEQRREMILANVHSDFNIPFSVKIVFKELPDNPFDNNAWAETVRHLVNSQARWDDKITLYGSDKDESTFYLQMFPEWNQGLSEVTNEFDATDLRRAWFEGHQTSRFFKGLRDKVPYATLDFLSSLKFNEDLQDEWKYYQDEALRFKCYPYAETLNFCCGDAIVRWRDYILFIRRGRVPGKGCLATPGGFKNRNETYLQAAIREFYEECRPNIPPESLNKCIKASHLFDDVSRSLGIPRNTLGVYFDLTDMFDTFPEIFPADDAAGYEWIHIGQLDDIAKETYDDHVFMVKFMIDKVAEIENILLSI